jgi:DNA primase
MNKQELLLSLRKLEIYEKDLQFRRGRNQVQLRCPLAKYTHKNGVDNNPSMGIIFGPQQITYYNCFACGEKGRLWQLFEDLGIRSERKDLLEYADHLVLKDEDSLIDQLEHSFLDIDVWIPEKETIRYKIIPEKILDLFEDVRLNEEGMKYLKSRNLEDKSLGRYKIKFDITRDRIIFPVIENKHLLGLQGRYIKDNKEVVKYYNYYEFDKSLCLGGIDELGDCNQLHIVEGWIDLLNIEPWAREEGIGVVTTFGAFPSQEQLNKIISLDKNVVFLYDNDIAGISGSKHGIEYLKDRIFNVKKGNLPENIDPGKLTKQEYLKILSELKRTI